MGILPDSYSMNEHYSYNSLTFTERAFTLTDGDSAGITTQDLEKVPDLENSYSNTVKVITSPETSYVLYSKQKFSLEASPTCTYNETIIKIQYEILSNNGQEIPDWISFDSSTSKYEGRAPKVINETIYSFVLKSVWKSTSSGESEQVVQITVNNDVPITTAGLVASSASTGAVASGGGVAAGASL